MQNDPTKISLNYQDNTYTIHYPPINQPQFGTNNIYQPYQSPLLPYVSYPPQPIAGAGYTASNVQYYEQRPLYPQENMVLAPTYRLFSVNQILTTITPNLRVFFIISGIIYIIWSLSIIGLEVAITVESYWILYRSVWTSGFILSGGICMLIVACRISYPMINLIRIFALALFFCLLGVTLSAVNYRASEKCSLWYASKYSCDNELVNILKFVNLIVLIVATIHTLINIVVFYNQHKESLLKSTVPNH